MVSCWNDIINSTCHLGNVISLVDWYISIFNMLCHVHAGFGDYFICVLTVFWPWVFNLSTKQIKINVVFVFVFRTSELVALMAISSTLFLFLHTRDLHTRLRSLQSVSNSASTSGMSQINEILHTNYTIVGLCSFILMYNCY